MRNSIRIKITLMVVIFSTFTILASWAICNFFIEYYFIHNIKNNLISTYYSCNDLFNEGEGSTQDGGLYGYIDNPAGATVFVIDTEMNIYSSIKISEKVRISLQDILDDYDASDFEGVKKYTIRRSYDENMGIAYFDLIGIMDNGYLIILRSPIEQVNTQVAFVTKLFVCVAMAMLLVGTIIILVITKVFSGPIRHMSFVAKRMANLDFDAKIDVITNDEIGELGSSMNEMSEKLEETISELKVANIKLEKDIKKKNQIDEMRKEFLSHVSHELKTPIALIQGYAEGLKDNISDDPESMEFYCDVIIDESNKMNMLVKKLLDLNEIEFGNNSITIERFELIEFLEDVINSSSILIEQSQAEIEFNEEGPLYVWADEFMMEEVFTNYLTNAIHYVTEGGKIKVWIDRKETTVRVNVYNQGEPIAEDDIDKVFIKFYKADKARTREYGGSGIGLSIVAAAMEAHNKEYGVYNVCDGVVFYFELDSSDTKGEVIETNHTKTENQD